jgi:hypothetical protein
MVMSNLPRFAAGVLLSLNLTGCANTDLGPKQTVGTLLGAQFGHGTGQLVATSVGTLLGAYLGNEAGKSLDRADALYGSRASTRRWSTLPRAAPRPGAIQIPATTAASPRSRRTRARMARIAANSSTRRRSAGAPATSTAPRAAPPMANGRWCSDQAPQAIGSSTDRPAEQGEFRVPRLR